MYKNIFLFRESKNKTIPILMRKSYGFEPATLSLTVNALDPTYGRHSSMEHKAHIVHIFNVINGAHRIQNTTQYIVTDVFCIYHTRTDLPTALCICTSIVHAAPVNVTTRIFSPIMNEKQILEIVKGKWTFGMPYAISP